MTECERIIKEGILPESFFKPETICDFYVDENRKKLWAVYIDILITIDKICKCNNIKYILGGGTLLGAVRHNGFIPWDDDIDIFLLRKEYDKLISILPREIPNYLELQVPGITDGYFWGHSKLRNKNTTCISMTFMHQPYNQGIGLDIFPIDNCIVGDAQNNYELIKSLLLENSANMRRNNPNPSEVDKLRMLQFVHRDGRIVCREVDAIAQKYNAQETEDVILAVATNYKVEKFIFRKEHFINLTELNFHGFNFPAPQSYDEMLKIQFGDYLSLPQIEARGTWHSNYYLDADCSWEETMKKLR